MSPYTGIVDCWSWLEPIRRRPELTHTGTATLLPIQAGTVDQLLVGLSVDFDLPLSDMLSDCLSPRPGLVRQLANLVDQLTIPPLRRFIARALLRKEVIRTYWTCPASQRDHHAYPGGLAEHSLEIAVAVATSKGLPLLEQELGIVYALLHDYGKLWWMDPELRDPNEKRNHEVLGRYQLKHDLDWLAVEDANLAQLMDELLGGPPVRRPLLYPLAIRKIVQAFDQMSCEKTRGLHLETRIAYEPEYPF